MYAKQERRHIKSTFSEEDVRRKREDRHLTLRKQKKDELLQKRRRAGPIGTPTDPNTLSKLQNLPQLVQKLQSPNPNEQLEATIQFRKFLSMERNPPIDEVVNAGVIPAFVQFLQRTESPQLQFEAAWALTNIASGTSEHCEKVVQHNAVIVLIQLLASPNDNVKEQAVWALGNIAGDSPKFRDYVLRAGVLPPLLKLISESPKISILRNATWTLSNLCRGKPLPDFSLVAPALPVLVHLLYNNDEEVLTDACWAISYLSDGPNDRIQAVIEANVVPRLVELLMYHQTTVQTPALRTIGNIVTGTDAQTQAVINAGALTCLQPLLTHIKKNIRKEACWTISNITAGNRDQIQAVIDAGLFPPLIKMMEKEDFEVRKEACWAISNATSGGSPEQIKYLVQRGCIKPLCDLLSYQDVKVINVALEGLDNILAAGQKFEDENDGVNIFAEYVDEAEGIEKIEHLQTHENEEIYKKAVKILETYFGVEEEEEGIPETTENSFSFGSNVHIPDGGFRF